MISTVGFSELRANLTSVSDYVMTQQREVTVFKNNKPAFKIVPLRRPDSMQDAYLAADEELEDEYQDVFEALAK